MATKDLKNRIRPALLYAANTTAATAYSYYVDLGAKYESCVIVLTYEANTADADTNYYTPALYEATSTPAASGSYSAVAAGDLEGSLSAIHATGTGIQYVGYKGGKRYLMVKLTEKGTADVEFHITAIVGDASSEPPAAPTTGAVS